MFAATAQGNVWVYPHPLDSAEFEEHFIHGTKRKNVRAMGPTLALLLPDMSRMVTTSVDGAIFLASTSIANSGALKDGKGADGASKSGNSSLGNPSLANLGAKKEPKPVVEIGQEEICLVEKQDLVDYEDSIVALKYDLDASHREHLKKLEQLKESYEEKLHYLKKAQGSSEVEMLRDRIGTLEEKLRDREQEPIRMIKALESQHVEATGMDMAAEIYLIYATAAYHF